MPNNMVLLETIALTESAASVTFDNLPTSGYTDLVIFVSARNTSSGASLRLRFNGTTTNHTDRYMEGNGSTVVSGSNAFGASYIFAGGINGSSTTSNTFASNFIYIPNYRSSNAKSISCDGVTENNATTAYADLSAGLWSNSSAITSIELTPNTNSFAANSTFSLYGVAALGTTPVLAPKATGGNIVANDGTYWYHAFVSTGAFIPQRELTADVLVVAGGGGSHQEGSGGGGAGGLLGFTSQVLASGTSYNCTIGAGGGVGNNGNNSQFSSLTAAIGGGKGGYGNGANGGSGGGGSGTNSYGLGTSGQGYNGSDNSGYAYNGWPRGAGGGAGGPGGAVTSNNKGGDGGPGSSAYSSWGLATATGHNVSGTVYYAGGGGGSTYSGGSGVSASTGGNGGGGAGGLGGAGASGLSGTGGGAGGNDTSNASVANGGSGIIIIRYPIA